MSKVRAAALKPGMKVRRAGTVLSVHTYTVSSDGEFAPYQTTIVQFDRKVFVPGRGVMNADYQCDPDEMLTVEDTP